MRWITCRILPRSTWWDRSTFLSTWMFLTRLLRPGVSHWEPGGLSTREAIRYLHALPGPIIGADLVEFNPVRDNSGFTATVAAKILKELLGKMIAA